MPNATPVTVNLDEWKSILDSIEVNRQDMNAMVYEYLRSVDLGEVAAEFSQEASVSASEETCKLAATKGELARLLNGNDLPEAESLCSELVSGTQGLDGQHMGLLLPLKFRFRLLDSLLHFRTTADSLRVLNEIRDSVAPLIDSIEGASDKALLRCELERVMLILLMDDPGHHVGEFHNHLRTSVDADIDSLLTVVFGKAEEPRLVYLMKNLVYSQNLDQKTKIPLLKDFSSSFDTQQ